MTPESIRRAQAGTLSVDDLLAEQAEAEGSTPKTKKVKAGAAIIEVPANSGQTDLALTERPQVAIPELVDWILAHPAATHAEISKAFGRTASWFASVLVMPEFQLAWEPHRDKVLNPGINATIEERMQALLVRSMEVLHTKLAGANPQDALVLESAKLSIRALGLGSAGREGPGAATPQSLESLADRLTALVTSRQKGAGIGSVPSAGDVVDVKSREVPNGDS